MGSPHRANFAVVASEGAEAAAPIFQSTEPAKDGRRPPSKRITDKDQSLDIHRRQAMLLNQQQTSQTHGHHGSQHHGHQQHLPAAHQQVSGGGGPSLSSELADESSDDDEKVDVGGAADLQSGVASLSCDKDDGEHKQNGCNREDSGDESMDKSSPSLNPLDHNGSPKDHKIDRLDGLGSPKNSQPNVTVGPAVPHPHLLPYLYPPALYSTSMGHLPLSQLFLSSAAASCSSSPTHPLPLSLFTSAGHPSSPGSFSASHLAQSSLGAGLSQGGNSFSMGHNLLLNAQLAFAAGHPMFHGYPGVSPGGLDPLVSSGSGINSSSGLLNNSKIKPHRFSPYPLPLTTGSLTSVSAPLTASAEAVRSPLSTSPYEPVAINASVGQQPQPLSHPLNHTSSLSKLSAISPHGSECGSSDGSVGPSSVSSSSDLKNIENMVNGLERQQEQLAAETLTRLTEK